MKAVFELSDTPLVYPEKRGTYLNAPISPDLVFLPKRKTVLCYPYCKQDFCIEVMADKTKSFTEILQTEKADLGWAEKTKPDLVSTRLTQFENQKVKGGGKPNLKAHCYRPGPRVLLETQIYHRRERKMG